MNDILEATEQVRLAELEATIERGKTTFIEVGNALAEIRDSRIYRATHATFEEYCKERWGWSRPAAYRMIDAAAVAANLSPIGDKPTTESQARPLAKLEPEQQPAAWEKAQEIAKEEGKPVTARHVEQAVSQVENKPSQAEETYRPAQAMSFAIMAIAQLERIDKRDIQKREAFQKVIDFCTKKMKTK